VVSKKALTIDTSNFNRAVKEMARMSGVNFEDVVKSEIGSVLSQTITHTARATKASIDRSFVKWVYISESSPAKRPQSSLSKGTAYLMVKGRGGVAHRYPDQIWSWINMSKDQRIKELRKRIGTAKKSWYLLAKGMRITLAKTPPAYVAAARVNGKELTDEVRHTRRVSMSKVGFMIENFTRAAIRGGGRAALLKAINGRTGYFYRNVRAGVFKKVGTIAKKYPGFRVRGI
jgi:hypothetical protein